MLIRVGDGFKLGRDLHFFFRCWVENTDGVTKAASKDPCWDRYCIRRLQPWSQVYFFFAVKQSVRSPAPWSFIWQWYQWFERWKRDSFVRWSTSEEGIMWKVKWVVPQSLDSVGRLIILLILSHQRRYDSKQVLSELFFSVVSSHV